LSFTMTTQHEYTTRVVWTGNTGKGTETYRSYERTWNIEVPGKPVVPCSNDPLLGGDPDLMNPEDLLLSALSACHMLWYLHLASEAGITVLGYQDSPLATGESETSGAGRFLEVTLQPEITVAAGSDVKAANAIHARIHEFCYIARSVNFPVKCCAKFHIE